MSLRRQPKTRTGRTKTVNATPGKQGFQPTQPQPPKPPTAAPETSPPKYPGAVAFRAGQKPPPVTPKDKAKEYDRGRYAESPAATLASNRMGPPTKISSTSGKDPVRPIREADLKVEDAEYEIIFHSGLHCKRVRFFGPLVDPTVSPDPVYAVEVPNLQDEYPGGHGTVIAHVQVGAYSMVRDLKGNLVRAAKNPKND